MTDPGVPTGENALTERLVALETELEEQKKTCEEQRRVADERLNRLQYLQADLENYRKSMEREKESIISLAEQYLMEDLLVVIDDLEQAIRSMDNGRHQEGLAMLSRKFLRILGDHGLVRIEAVGRPFDPAIHMAVSREPSNRDDGTVIDELRPGYLLKAKVLRPALVKVAEQASAKEGTSNGKGEDNRD